MLHMPPSMTVVVSVPPPSVSTGIGSCAGRSSCTTTSGVPPSPFCALPPQPVTSRLAATTGHRAIHFTLALPFLGVFTFVPLLLAVYEGDLGFDPTFLLVQRQRYQRIALLSNLAHQPIDLAPVQQQLALATGRVVAAVREGVDAHVHLVQPGLAAVDVGE